MKKNKYSMFWLLLFVFLFSTNTIQAQLADNPWPMFGHDERHTFKSPHKGPDSIKIAWIFKLDSKISLNDDAYEYTSPVIGTNGDVYITTEGAYLYSISPSGVLNWKIDLSESSFNAIFTPTIGKNGIIYVAVELNSAQSALYAINKSGEIIWKTKYGTYSPSSPAIGEDGTI